MVGGQIRFALYGIDNDTFRLKCRRWTQFYLCRETSATQTYDTGVRNLLHDFLGCEVTLFYQRIGTVDGFFPLISLYINEDSRFSVSAGIDNCVNFSDLSADRRMDGCRYETAGFGNLCTYFHNITFSYDRLCRSTDMLAQ